MQLLKCLQQKFCFFLYIVANVQYQFFTAQQTRTSRSMKKLRPPQYSFP